MFAKFFILYLIGSALAEDDVNIISLSGSENGSPDASPSLYGGVQPIQSENKYQPKLIEKPSQSPLSGEQRPVLQKPLPPAAPLAQKPWSGEQVPQKPVLPAAAPVIQKPWSGQSEQVIQRPLSQAPQKPILASAPVIQRPLSQAPQKPILASAPVIQKPWSGQSEQIIQRPLSQAPQKPILASAPVVQKPWSGQQEQVLHKPLPSAPQRPLLSLPQRQVIQRPIAEAPVKPLEVLRRPIQLIPSRPVESAVEQILPRPLSSAPLLRPQISPPRVISSHVVRQEAPRLLRPLVSVLSPSQPLVSVSNSNFAPSLSVKPIVSVSDSSLVPIRSVSSIGLPAVSSIRRTIFPSISSYSSVPVGGRSLIAAAAPVIPSSSGISTSYAASISSNPVINAPSTTVLGAPAVSTLTVPASSVLSTYSHAQSGPTTSHTVSTYSGAGQPKYAYIAPAPVRTVAFAPRYVF